MLDLTRQHTVISKKKRSTVLNSIMIGIKDCSVNTIHMPHLIMLPGFVECIIWSFKIPYSYACRHRAY